MTLIEKILKFDNSLDNSVVYFNELFDEKLPYDDTDQVEILEPYTVNGRMISINGNEPVQYLFGDQPFSKQSTNTITEWKKIYRDGKLFGSYISARLLARDLEISEDYARDLLIRRYTLKGIEVVDFKSKEF